MLKHTFQLILVGLMIALAIPVNAQVCNCDDDLETLGLLDGLIVEHQAKAQAVAAGRTEHVSGLSNNLDVLNAQIRELEQVRGATIAAIIDCQMRCRLYDDAGEFDPLSAFTGVTAACPQAQDEEQRLDEWEVYLAEQMNRLAELREATGANRLAEDPNYDFQVALMRYDVEVEELQRLRAQHQELLDAAAAALARVDSHEYFNQEYRDENGVPYFTGFLFFMAGEVVDGLASAFDNAILMEEQQHTHPDRDWSGILQSRYGEAIRAERAARDFYREWVSPQESAVSVARRMLPLDHTWSDPSYSESHTRYRARDVELFEDRIRSSIRSRDNALMRLIVANIECRQMPPRPTTFDEGSSYYDDPLEDELNAPADPPPGGPDDGLDGRGPELDLPAEDEPSLMEELLDGLGLDDVDFLGEPPAPSDDATEETATDEEPMDGMGLPEDDLQGLGELTGGEIPAPPSAPSLGGFSTIDRDATAGLTNFGAPPGVCEFTVDDICPKFWPDQRGQCEAEVGGWLDRCHAWQARVAAEQDGPTTCHQSCDIALDGAHVQMTLQLMALHTLSQASATHLAPNNSEEISDIRGQIALLEALPATRITHIYRNEDTGALVEHAGEYFEPNPPLTHIGQVGGRLSDLEEAELRNLRRQLIAALAVEAENNAAAAEHQAWFEDSYDSWNGGGRWPDPVVCDAVRAGDQYEACHAACDEAGEAASARSFCAGSIAGQLWYDRARWRLYPEGHPDRGP